MFFRSGKLKVIYFIFSFLVNFALKFPNSCDSEYFFISLDGDLQFRDGQRFCRTSQFTHISNFRSIALAYSSLRPNTALRGRFNCQARARRVPCRCGWSLTTRIANGREARHNEFPSTVALRDVTSPQRVFCGGNISNFS